ncbi:MAG: hypothetical protein M0T74_13220 [Desulfitobacterium hafniense]|nr:hypothetical protein [Desulfitobacterium hafniense]
MKFNEIETKRILDEGMITRSLIECEVAMKKCQLYSEMANDPTIKAFFKDQSKGLEDVMGYLKGAMGDLR